jgi:hypothetical protein
MSINIIWKIDGIDGQVQEEGYTDVVYVIHWRVYASQEEATTSVYGSCNVTFTPSDNFIPYEELTEEQVLAWAFDSLGEEGKTKAEQAVVSELENILEPQVVSKPLPWS